MNVISYFNLIPGFEFSLESKELIDIWKKSWQKHGWNTILLDESYAKNNPLFDELDLDNPDANFYRKTNPSVWQYHRRCYCRLLAYCQYVRENGATLYADYDVINYGFSPNILNLTKENSYFCGERAVVFLGRVGAVEIEQAMLVFSKETSVNCHSSDAYVIEKYTKCFVPIYRNLETNEGGDYYYIAYPYTPRQNIAPLIHYHGGCNKEAETKLTRLQVINQNNRL